MAAQEIDLEKELDEPVPRVGLPGADAAGSESEEEVETAAARFYVDLDECSKHTHTGAHPQTCMNIWIAFFFADGVLSFEEQFKKWRAEHELPPSSPAAAPASAPATATSAEGNAIPALQSALSSSAAAVSGSAEGGAARASKRKARDSDESESSDEDAEDGSAPKNRASRDTYDLSDAFIDDSELVIAHALLSASHSFPFPPFLTLRVSGRGERNRNRGVCCAFGQKEACRSQRISVRLFPTDLRWMRGRGTLTARAMWMCSGLRSRRRSRSAKRNASHPNRRYDSSFL
jgi:hypothetical protein